MGNNDLREENLKIDNLKSLISRDINMSNLSIGVVYYIIKDCLNEIDKLYNIQVEKEYQNFCELVKKEKEETTETVEEIKEEEK